MTAQDLELLPGDVANLARGGQLTTRMDGLTVHFYPGDDAPRAGVDEDAVLIPLTGAMLYELHVTGETSWFSTFTETKYRLLVAR